MLLVRHAAPSASQTSEPLLRQFLKRSPESLIPETPRLPSLVWYTVGSTTKRQADGTEEEEARAYLDVDLGGFWVWCLGVCPGSVRMTAGHQPAAATD